MGSRATLDLFNYLVRKMHKALNTKKNRPDDSGRFSHGLRLAVILILLVLVKVLIDDNLIRGVRVFINYDIFTWDNRVCVINDSITYAVTFAHYGESGIDVYADFLVERERFSEWAALMHRYDVSYDGAEAGGLKLALSTDPAAVMPLLHTYAMRFIKEKNRHSYRRAVRLFKKMKAGSKKNGISPS